MAVLLIMWTTNAAMSAAPGINGRAQNRRKDDAVNVPVAGLPSVPVIVVAGANASVPLLVAVWSPLRLVTVIVTVVALPLFCSAMVPAKVAVFEPFPAR